ncbi:MAG: pirin family protein [Gracilibacteraceae bacterium]|jgi:redox-sensitive bicupin YhaK (pirin superfamily)|nr:pirin family protein [Gracilibacteraceae bacterium]
MLKYIDHTKMGRGKHGWLDSHFHFSFAEYYNPANIQFGALRVVNDDIVQAGKGFDTHPHKNMEIISYVVNGELTHADSMKNRSALMRGQVQYMSAGTGVTHSEYNSGDKPLRFLQIWILPDKNGYAPSYGDHRFAWEDRLDKWLPIASGNPASSAPIKIHADVNVYAAQITRGGELAFETRPGRQTYLVLIEGAAQIGGHVLAERDAMEITEQDITVSATDTAHVIALEMAKA